MFKENFFKEDATTYESMHQINLLRASLQKTSMVDCHSENILPVMEWDSGNLMVLQKMMYHYPCSLSDRRGKPGL